MSNLQTYIDRKNVMRGIFGDELITTHVRRLTEKDATILFDAIDCDLSPENLACDGEASAAHMKREFNLLSKAKRELIALGFEVTA